MATSWSIFRPLDAQHFGIMPGIENKNDLLNGTDNHHSIDGYLPDAAVARQIWKGVSQLTSTWEILHA